MIATLSACAADAPAPPAISGLERIPGATPQQTADPVLVAGYHVAAAFELPLSTNEQMQVALTRLATLTHSKSATDRQAAAFANCEVGHIIEQRVVLQTLRTLLADPEPKVRKEALYSCIGCSGLWRIALPALPQITPLYSDTDPEVRRAARFVGTQLRSLKAQSPK
jgi:HEAT repeat protein